MATATNTQDAGTPADADATGDARAESRGTDLPLAGMTVVDFSQFLSGPVAALRLADLGARVIKVERPGVGDLGRNLSFQGLRYQGDTLSFHAMNRGKESFAADLKASADLDVVREILRRADVVIANFRPGVMERLGLDYESARRLNPRLVYGSISGYGTDGPWRSLPGQDLLAQARSGLTWLSGDRGQGPVPVGVSLADHLASIHLAQGITAVLVRRQRTGRGGLVETSLLEGLLDLQFEVLTAHFSAGPVEADRGDRFSASAFIEAPYGTYPTQDGYLAVAMNPVDRLGRLLGSAELEHYDDPDRWWEDREAIRALLADRLSTEPTAHWQAILEAADVWCAPVLTVAELADTDAFAHLAMIQPTFRPGDDGQADLHLRTTRSPLRIDGSTLTHSAGAPRLGQHSQAIIAEYARPAVERSPEATR